MEIEQDCSIFYHQDIADLIFDKLDFVTIQKSRCVNDSPLYPNIIINILKMR